MMSFIYLFCSEINIILLLIIINLIFLFLSIFTKDILFQVCFIISSVVLCILIILLILDVVSYCYTNNNIYEITFKKDEITEQTSEPKLVLEKDPELIQNPELIPNPELVLIPGLIINKPS